MKLADACEANVDRHQGTFTNHRINAIAPSPLCLFARQMAPVRSVPLFQRTSRVTVNPINVKE